MKIKISIGLFLIIVFIIVSVCGCSNGKTETPEDTSLSDTQTDQNSSVIGGCTWELQGGATYTDGVLNCPKGSFARCLDQNLNNSMIVEFDMSTSSISTSGFAINNHEENDYYVFSVNPSSDKIQLTKFKKDINETPGSAFFDSDKNSFYHVKLVITSTYLKAYVSKEGEEAPKYQQLDVKIDKYRPNCVSVLATDTDVILKNIEIRDNDMKLSANERYVNPIASGADPYVLYHEGVYYMYSTNAVLEGYEVFTSTDLTNWKNNGLCLKNADVYGTPDNSQGFWAPEVYYYKDKFYMIYTVEQHLGVAVADSPLGPFKSPNQRFLSEHKEIDGHLFFDDDGKIYIFFVRTGRTDGRPHGNEIFGAEFDMESLTYKNEKCLLYPENKGSWEWKGDYGYVTEGPAVLKHDGRYYMTYSANGYTSPNYAIGLAISDSPLGQYQKYENNPILKKSVANDVYGPGHHCFTTSPDGTELFVVYHKHKSATEVHGRLICIDRAYFEYDASLGYDILKMVGPTSTAQPLPSGMKKQ